MAIETYEDLKNDWRDKMAIEFGSDINTGDNSNMYKLIMPILKNLFSKYNTLNSFMDNKYIYTAEGVYLDKFMGNYNFIRKQASKATTNWRTLNSLPNTFIAVGALQVQDELGNIFINTTSGNTNSHGDLSVEMESINTGEDQNIQAGTLTDIITPIAGIGDGENEEDATGGQDQETDIEFRNRFLAGRAGKGYWNIDGVYRALIALNGVSSVVVDENDQNIIVNGLPPHSIHCVVDGGEDDLIAQIIFEKTDTAIERVGNRMIVVEDLQGELRDVYFSRPSFVNVEVKYTVIGTVDNTGLEVALIDYVNNVGIGGTLSSWKASNYIETQVDISQITSLTIEMKLSTSSNFSSIIQLGNIEKADGILI